MQLKAGDPVFTMAQPDSKSGGFISRQILWWNTAWFEPETKCSHMAMIAEDSAVIFENDDADFNYKMLANVPVIEQTSGGQRKVKLGKYLESSNVFIYHNEMVGVPDSEALTRAGLNDLGDPYGYGKILLFLLDAALGKLMSLPICLVGLLFGKRLRGIEIPIFSLLNLTGDYVCSQTIAKYYWLILGICYGEHWRGVTPDRAMDWCESNGQWTQVYSNEVKIKDHEIQGCIDCLV